MITLLLFLTVSSAPAAEPPRLYAPAEAVADVLSGPLEYVGRGPWFGMARWESCLYRNKKVLVVDVYCSRSWPRAFSLRVFSPTRGRTRIHLESETPITELSRERYEDSLWKIESEPPPGRDLLPTRLRLDMSFVDLRDYEEARYQLYLPACYTTDGGARCHRDLATASDSWSAAVMPFWKKPGKSWQRLVARMRELAAEHGT